MLIFIMWQFEVVKLTMKYFHIVLVVRYVNIQCLYVPHVGFLTTKKTVILIAV
jgi:hypothetical protein